MLVTIAKTIFQIVNFMLWLVGLCVLGMTCWIISDYDLAMVRGDLLTMMGGILTVYLWYSSVPSLECSHFILR